MNLLWMKRAKKQFRVAEQQSHTLTDFSRRSWHRRCNGCLVFSSRILVSYGKARIATSIMPVKSKTGLCLFVGSRTSLDLALASGGGRREGR